MTVGSELLWAELSELMSGTTSATGGAELTDELEALVLAETLERTTVEVLDDELLDIADELLVKVDELLVTVDELLISEELDDEILEE